MPKQARARQRASAAGAAAAAAAVAAGAAAAAAAAAVAAMGVYTPDDTHDAVEVARLERLIVAVGLAKQKLRTYLAALLRARGLGRYVRSILARALDADPQYAMIPNAHTSDDLAANHAKSTKKSLDLRRHLQHGIAILFME